jgi:DNA-binding XRE family transcriptional regulator
MATLREIRERMMMTREELAAKVEVSASTIFKIEAGTQVPRIPLKRRLGAALGVEPSEIEYGVKTTETRPKKVAA